MVVPLFECSAVIYRGRPILVLAASRALNSAGRSVRLRVRTLRDLARRLGFGQLDPSLAGEWSASTALVAGGLNGVTLEVDGRWPQVIEIAVPTQEWLDLASAAGSVHVVLLAPRGFRRDFIRSGLRRMRAFGGQVPMVSHETAVWGERYTFLGRTSSDQPRPQSCTVVLDSCVVVDLERALAVGADQRRVAQTQSLVLQLIHMDVVPGQAIAELVADRTRGTYDRDRAHGLVAAVNAWFDGGAARASSIDDVREAYTEALNGTPSALDLPVEYQADPRQLLHYAGLLKLAQLWSQARGGFRASQRVDLYAEYASWMTHGLGIVSAYPLQVARDRLIGPQGHAANYVDQLLKFGKGPLHSLWGASWDLHHIAMLDIIQDGEVIDIAGRKVMLVTADRALVRLRDRVHDLTMRTQTSRGLLPLKAARSDVDRRLVDHVGRIEAIHEEMNAAVWARASSGAEMPTLDHVLAEIAHLEGVVEALMLKPTR